MSDASFPPDVTSLVGSLTPVMLPSSAPTWSEAVWVGEIDDGALPDTPLAVRGGAGYARARLLVRRGRRPRGFVHVPLYSGWLYPAEIRAAVATLPEPEAMAERVASPPITVIVCTRDRPDQLRTALSSVLALDYPQFEVLVVDNNPASGQTGSLVRRIADPRLRLVDAPVPGLARARNAGISAARHAIVAFTDDDVVVDRWWLHGLADGFAAAPGVACVCGMVPSGELAFASQGYFDRRVQWAQSCRPETFWISDVRRAEPLFPFQVGRFGTGANFAMRREVAFALEGFDEALGIGSPTGGGEDIDMFLRVLLAGHRLVYEPAAVVWHRHRSDLPTLSRQIRDYGTGLGAWLAKLTLDRRTAAMMLRRALPALRHIRRITHVDMTATADEVFMDLGRVELVAVLGGPAALWRARRAGARARPLRGAEMPIPQPEPHVAAGSELANCVEVAL